MGCEHQKRNEVGSYAGCMMCAEALRTELAAVKAKLAERDQQLVSAKCAADENREAWQGVTAKLAIAAEALEDIARADNNEAAGRALARIRGST